MAGDATGTLHVQHEGRDLALRLSWGALAKLEAMHPAIVNALLRDAGASEVTVQFILDAVSVALQKGSRIDAAEADELADALLTADPDLFKRLMTTASPGASRGNAPAPEADPG